MTTQAAQKSAAQKKLDDARAHDPFWVDDGFSPIDLRGLPTMQPLVGESNSSWIDEQFAPLDERGSGAGARDLKAFIEEQVNRAQGPNQVHLGNDVIGELKQDADGWFCQYQFNGARHITRGSSADDAAVRAARYVQNWQPDTRDLSAEEEQLVTWMAQSGKAVQAAEKYIRLAIPRAGELGEKVLTAPKFAATVDEAVFFAWSRARNDYSLADKDFPKYLKRFARHKRLTLAVCDAAFQSYQDELNKAEREAMFQPPVERMPEQSDLEQMSDDEINRSYRSVAAALARR